MLDFLLQDKGMDLKENSVFKNPMDILQSLGSSSYIEDKNYGDVSR